MPPEVNDFDHWRRRAAFKFAQTMIVIDDEASQAPAEEPEITKLKRPDRASAKKEVPPAEASVEKHWGAKDQTHALNAKALIDRAMELGLICTVLRPEKEEDFLKRVVRAAQVADIVCLDWEIYGDSGEAATNIIKAILIDDASKSGRLRLVAIYTGDKTNQKILDKIFSSVPEKLKKEHDMKKDSLKIVGAGGLRIVCLFKSHGVRLADSRNINQISESELPDRLQEEFSKLSEGLLSNVALSTIASIRNSTHHVLSKFVGRMDGPYFHHRACIPEAEDAEAYAVEIVLSELKSAVDRLQIASDFAGEEAISDRIAELSSGASALQLHYKGVGGVKSHKLDVAVATRMIVAGFESVSSTDRGANAPKTRVFEENISSLFSAGYDESIAERLEFAGLTGIRAHPGSYLYKKGKLKPTLGLGSVIRTDQREYLLCLQASCDAVRIKDKKAFIFVPLEIVEGEAKPEHAVPVPRSGNSIEYVGLATSKGSYAVLRSIEFLPNKETNTIVATRHRWGHFFGDIEGNRYRWIVDLKRRRALRTVQQLGQEMGRLGFDEFEPYRKKNSA